MLRTAPIRSKVIAVVVVPLVGLLVLAAAGIGTTLARGAEAHRVNDLAQLAVRGDTLVHELQAERTLSSGLVAARADQAAVPREGMVTQRVVVDRTVAAFTAFAAGLDSGGYDPKLRQALDRAVREVGGLAGIRQRIDTAGDAGVTSEAVERAYSEIVLVLLDLNANIGLGTNDEALFRSVTVFVALSHVKDANDLERGFQLSGLLGSDPDRQRFKRFVSFVDQRETWLAQLRASATPEQFASYQGAVSPPEADRAVAIEQAALRGSAADLQAAGSGERLDRLWFAAMTERVDKLRRVERGFAADLIRTSRSVAASANRQIVLWLAGTIALLVITALLSLLIARSLIDPLRSLQDTAEDVARRQLPEAVERIQQLPAPGQAEVPTGGQPWPFDAAAQDEISRVARSFNAVQEVAIKIAGEQAGLRRSVADMFQNLAQRTQALVRGSMELVDELEQDETRPDTLERLFRLDHLITRMRRNAENLIVLSGAELPNQWEEPVPLDVLIRSATAEVADYQRVQSLPIGEFQVAGRACVDVIHLLAELIENATRFSAPGAKVSVAGQPIHNGHVIEIEDQGIGMSEEEMTQANQHLAEPPAVDLALSQRVGLHVVARLAKRHSIRVQLRHSWYGGVVALILLPNDILVRPPGTSAPPDPERLASHLAGHAGQGRVAVLDPPQAWSDQPDIQPHMPLRRHLGTDDLRRSRYDTVPPAWPASNAGTDPDGTPFGEPTPGAGVTWDTGQPDRTPTSEPASSPPEPPDQASELWWGSEDVAPPERPTR